MEYATACNGTVSEEQGVGDGNEHVDEGQESVGMARPAHRDGDP